MPENKLSKRFNITGLCVPESHYMVDIQNKLDEIVENYISDGQYFAIYRARQYGKTTTLTLLERALRQECVVIQLTVEGRDDYFASSRAFANGVRLDIRNALKTGAPGLASPWDVSIDPELPMMDLGERITKLCEDSDVDVILMVDEVDKASDNSIFLNFLGLLRDKYLNRSKSGAPTFKSVILAGVHDIKSLKHKIRPDEDRRMNSPWNIAVNFDVDMSFSSTEIAGMLADYESDHNTGMDIPPVSRRLRYYTSGYPYLVSCLCKIIDEGNLGFGVPGVDEAVRRLLKMDNTLFDDIIKNIVNDPPFGELVRRILLDGSELSFDSLNPEISTGAMFGILSEKDGLVAVSNVIFETRIFDYFVSVAQTQLIIKPAPDPASLFVRGGVLDMDGVLDRFSVFMRSEYRDEDGDFIERHARLLFLGFLKPIINGVGHYTVEPETRGGRKIDVAVFYGNREYIVELKIWRGREAEKRAYDQLGGYLTSRGQKKGYLLSFADNIKSPREDATLVHDGHEIREVVIAYRDRE
jgi:hypothetical protein